MDTLMSVFEDLYRKYDLVRVVIQRSTPGVVLPFFVKGDLVALDLSAEFVDKRNYNLSWDAEGCRAVLSFRGVPHEVYFPWDAIQAFLTKGDPAPEKKRHLHLVKPEPVTTPDWVRYEDNSWVFRDGEAVVVHDEEMTTIAIPSRNFDKRKDLLSEAESLIAWLSTNPNTTATEWSKE